MVSIYEKQSCKREIYLLSGRELEQEPKEPAKHKAHFGTTLQFFQNEIHIP